MFDKILTEDLEVKEVEGFEPSKVAKKAPKQPGKPESKEPGESGNELAPVPYPRFKEVLTELRSLQAWKKQVEAEHQLQQEQAAEEHTKALEEAGNYQKLYEQEKRRRIAAEKQLESIKVEQYETLKIRVGTRLGLPEILAQSLKGESEEELESHGQEMLAAIASRSQATKEPQQTRRPVTSEQPPARLSNRELMARKLAADPQLYSEL